MSENASFKYGAVQSPLPSSTSNSLLQDADPVLAAMLDFYKGVIELHCGARWSSEVQRLGLDAQYPVVVNDVYSVDPTYYMQEAQMGFPLLAVVRKELDFSYLTTIKDKITSTMELIYVLPPLDLAQANTLMHFLKHIASVIQNRTEQGFDSNYQAGKLVWRESGVCEINLKSAKLETYQPNSGQYFPALVIEIEAVELLGEPTDLYEPLGGIDGTVENDSAVEVTKFKID